MSGEVQRAINLPFVKQKIHFNKPQTGDYFDKRYSPLMKKNENQNEHGVYKERRMCPSTSRTE